MLIKQKMINSYDITLDSVSNIFIVTVRKSGVDNPIFLRSYNSLNSARRSFNSWCIKIDDINRSEVTYVC